MFQNRIRTVAFLGLLGLTILPGSASAQFVSGINTPFFRAGLFPGGAAQYAAPLAAELRALCAPGTPPASHLNTRGRNRPTE